jgi:hypothetical protein
MNTITTTTPGKPVLRRVREGYWRVTASSGAVLGYIEETTAGAPPAERPRYRAKRLLPGGARVAELGEFAEQTDAVACLR